MSDVEIIFNNFSEIAARSPEKADKIVRKIAFLIQGDAKSIAPVDTGALKASIYTVTSTGRDGFIRGASAAQGRNLEVQTQDEGLVAQKGEAFVAVAVDYGWIVEMRQPYLIPVAESYIEPFRTAMNSIVE